MAHKPRWNDLLAIFLIAGASLLFEVTVTKYFSYSLWANYAYLVISTAMFGLGMSGVVLTRWPGLLKFNEAGFLGIASVAAAVTTVIAFVAINFIPIHLPSAPNGWGQEMASVAIDFLILAIPFFCVGIIISFIFERRGEAANTYYFADLVGAGLGCFLIVPLIHALEPQGLALLSVLMMLAGAVLFGWEAFLRLRAGRLIAAALLVAIAIAAVTTTPAVHSLFPLRIHVEKRTYSQDVERGAIEVSGWSTLSKVDIAEAGEDIKRVWIDAGVNWSAIQSFDGDFKNAGNEREAILKGAAQVLDYHALPHLSKTNHTVAVIGTSGGEDSLYALMCGARYVAGIEMDPMIAYFVTNTYREFAGGLFTDGVYSEMIVDEGRSYLRRCGKKFDVIQQVNNFTPIAFQNGALNLSETYLLTVESFRDFYNQLTDDGVLCISRYGSIRMLSIAVEMFRQMGMKPEDYSRHLFVGEGPQWVINTFMMKKSPFTEKEIDTLFAFYGAVPHGRQILYAPYRTADLPDLENNLYYQMATAADPTPYMTLGCYDFRPCTDDWPFFNHMKFFGAKERDIRRDPRLPGEILNIDAKNKIDRRVPPGDLPPLIVLVESILLASVFFGIPLFSKKEFRANLREHRRTLGYFGCLGIAFIIIEICLIQQLLLFLGSPVYSISTVLASLLIFAGIGSYVSGLIPPRQRNIQILLAVTAAVLIGLRYLIPYLTGMFLSSGFTTRVAVSAVITGIAGFFMGMPMPTGVRFLKSENRPVISWAWAINGYFTVIGSALSVLLATLYGFSFIFYTAAVVYAVAPLFLKKKSKG